MSGKIDVGILGATGTVGQEFIAQLEDHPWFRVGWIGASERSATKQYRDATPWRLPVTRPDRIADMTLERVTPGRAPELVFSGLAASVAGEVEVEFAEAGHVVVSNARNHRMDSLVPLVIPEINRDHLQLLPAQRVAKGWAGCIVTNPNCSTIIMLVPVTPLHRAVGVDRMVISTYQAASGAGAAAMIELETQAREYVEGRKRLTTDIFGQQYIFNVFSHDSDIGPDGYNTEETKMVNDVIE